MKRLAIYLAITFGLTWGLLIPAGLLLGTFERGEGSSMIMYVLIALSMFFPLIGALVANAASRKEDRIDLCVRPLIRGNVRTYLIAWFAPAAITLLGPSPLGLVAGIPLIALGAYSLRRLCAR